MNGIHSPVRALQLITKTEQAQNALLYSYWMKNFFFFLIKKKKIMALIVFFFFKGNIKENEEKNWKIPDSFSFCKYISN